MLKSICLHGPESTGKSTIVPRLARHFDSVCIAEFGRTYCEAFGTDLTMADLLAIARGHDAKTAFALAAGHKPVILDTDPLMTAVWADMMFGRRDRWFDEWHNYADFYLLFDIDLPFVEDGSRVYGSPALRQRFFELSRAELVKRNLPWALVSGQGEMRYLNTLAAIAKAARELG